MNKGTMIFVLAIGTTLLGVGIYKLLVYKKTPPPAPNVTKQNYVCADIKKKGGMFQLWKTKTVSECRWV